MEELLLPDCLSSLENLNVAFEPTNLGKIHPLIVTWRDLSIIIKLAVHIIVSERVKTEDLELPISISPIAGTEDELRLDQGVLKQSLFGVVSSKEIFGVFTGKLHLVIREIPLDFFTHFLIRLITPSTGLSEGLTKIQEYVVSEHSDRILLAWH